MVHAPTEVKSTLCVKQRAAGGGRSDYYSKPLNEFKNSYFGAFAIQSLCLGLMQKMPFAFALRGALCVCAPMRARITATANLYDIPLHYYHSWSPVQLITAGDVWEANLQCNICTVCSALLGKISERTVQNSRTEVWCCSDPSCCSNTSLWGFSVFFMMQLAWQLAELQSLVCSE